jgi:hypothetical protein
MAASPQRARAEHLVDEPFRVFFPVGFLLAVVGALLWPLFFWGAIVTYPGMMHARLMIEGFMACFIFGFLGRLARAFIGAAISRAAKCCACSPPCSVPRSHISLADTRSATACFLLALLLFATSLARRFMTREDSPPAKFRSRWAWLTQRHRRRRGAVLLRNHQLASGSLPPRPIRS